MESVWETALKTLLGFSVLLLLTRLLAKKQLSQMTLFTYITGFALGNIAGEMVLDNKIRIADGITALALWAMLTYGIEHLSLKSPKARVLLDGEPTIVIRNGKILERAMASCKLNMDDLTMLLREKNVFSVREVDYAILEPNGKLSVMKKPEYDFVTRKDLNVPYSRPAYMPTELVVDGHVVARNLRELDLSREWLERELRKFGAQSAHDVYFAELESDGTVHVDLKSERP